MLRVPERFLEVTLAVFVLSACSENPDRIPEPVLDAWEHRWSASVEVQISNVTAEYRDKVSSKVTLEKRDAFIENMRQVFSDELSWEASGKIAVEKHLRETCGIDFLNELGPYFSDEISRDEMPEQLKAESASCAVETDLFVDTSPAYTMYEIAARELPSLFRRHGIDPKGL